MPSRPPTFRPPGWSPQPRRRALPQDQFYKSPQWKALRSACLQRDGFMCAERDCRTPQRGRGGRLIAHHLIARTKGGPDRLDNLRTRCPACDALGHAEKGGARG